MAKYTFETTTVGEMLDAPDARALIEEMAPQLLEHPLLEVGRSFIFADALPYISDMISEDDLELFRGRLEAL